MGEAKNKNTFYTFVINSKYSTLFSKAAIKWTNI